MVRPCRYTKPHAASAAAPIVKGMIALAIRLEVPPKISGHRPPTNAMPAASQKDQTSRSCTETWFTSGILSFVPPQNKLISISAQRRVFGSRGGSRLPACGDVGGLAEGQLPDEEGGEERDGDDRHAGQEYRVEGVRQAVAHPQLHRRRQVRELRGIEHGRGGCSSAGRLQLGQH